MTTKKWIQTLCIQHSHSKICIVETKKEKDKIGSCREAKAVKKTPLHTIAV